MRQAFLYDVHFQSGYLSKNGLRSGMLRSTFWRNRFVNQTPVI